MTDANLMPGRLGSAMKLASSLAPDGLATQFGGMEAHGLADGVIRIAVARMCTCAYSLVNRPGKGFTV